MMWPIVNRIVELPPIFWVIVLGVVLAMAFPTRQWTGHDEQ